MYRGWDPPSGILNVRRVLLILGGMHMSRSPTMVGAASLPGARLRKEQKVCIEGWGRRL